MAAIFHSNPPASLRFNRRYQLDTLTERLAYACARADLTRTASSSPHE